MAAPIRHGVYTLARESYERSGWAYLFFYESLKLMLFASLWLSIIFGLESFGRWQHERERLLALQRHLAETQLAQLRAQLQPHFLFNALGTTILICVLLYEGVLRRFAITRVLFGIKAREPAGQRTGSRFSAAVSDL